MYFALGGAKKVIAIKPHPEAFREMIENIRLNNLERIIIPVNAGLASRAGETRVENVNVERTAVIYDKPGRCATLVSAITLADVIEGYAINLSAILKMDCKGCEYDVIFNDYKHISIFKELSYYSSVKLKL
jgi:FkbM family methyltransferase